MISKDISETKAEVSATIEAIDHGEEVFFDRRGRNEAGMPAAKLVRATEGAMTRMPGALQGQITIREGFDELPPDVAAALGIEP